MTLYCSSPNTQACFKLVIMSLFFGGTFIAGRLIANEIPAAPAAFLRFSVASACLLSLLYQQEQRFPVPTLRECFGLTCLALTGIFGYNLFFLQALQTVEASHTAALVSCNPVLIALLSALFFGECITWCNVFGICLSVSGAMVVAAKGDLQTLTHFSTGDKAVAAAICCWALYSVIGKQMLKTLSPLTSVAYSAVIGALMLGVLTFCNGELWLAGSLSGQTWLSILYLAVPGTVIAFWFYYQGIESLGVIKAGIFINLIPVSTLVLSALILGEIPGPDMLGGTFLVICGVFLVNRAK